MKRFHVHVSVGDLEASKAFYSRLFGAVPAVERHDDARWLGTVDLQGIVWESFHTPGAVEQDGHGTPAARESACGEGACCLR